MCLQAQAVVILPACLEGATVQAAVQYLNDYGTKRFPTQTPRFMFEGRKIDLNIRNHIPFGTVGLATNHDNRADAVKKKVVIVLGPSEKTYNCMEVYVNSSKCIVSRSEKDIEVLKVLPDKLPWPPKVGQKILTAPTKVINRSKKRVLNSNLNQNQINAANQLLSHVRLPTVESDREGDMQMSSDSKLKRNKRSKITEENTNKLTKSKLSTKNSRNVQESESVSESSVYSDESDGTSDDDLFIQRPEMEIADE